MTTSSSRRARGLRRLLPGIAALALVTLFTPFIAFQPAVAAEGDPDEPVLIQFEKDAIPAAPTAVAAGGTITYQFTINCSSLETDCLDLTLADTIPAPLVLQSVTMATQNPPIDIQISGNDFTVEVIDELGGGFTGMQAGTGIQLNATATVPADLSADFDGELLDNTAQVTVANRADLTLDPPRPNLVESSAQVLLTVPRVLGSDTTKTVTPESSPAALGRAVEFALGATNTSNGSVDELVIQEPADTSSTILDYIEITGLSGLDLPAGADRVRIDWFDGVDWNTGTAAATAALPVGVDTADIRGIRIVFSSSTGRVDRGAIGGITIEGELTSTAAALASTLTLTNTASSWVRFDATTTTPEPAADTIRLDPSSVSPIATKLFENPYVVGGALERATIGGQNGGDFALKELTLTEPAPGTTSLADQGLSFDSWITADIEWPVSATSAEVSYWYEGHADFSAPIVTTTVDTLPAPTDAALVQSIRVRFLSTAPGGMTPGQYASLPFLVLTDAVVSDVTTTNQVRVDVVALDDQTASAVASDDLTRRTSRVNTLVDKSITPDTIYGIAGSTTLISLPSSITPLPVTAVDPTASTVGSVSLVITDPVDTGADDFYNFFDLTDIVATAVPANTTLTVEYFDGATWNILPGASGLVGPTFLTTAVDPALRADIEGVRFTYQHADYDTVGTLLNPGFSVQPNVRFALRDQLRDGTGDAASATRVDPIEIDNTVLSRVSNPVATPSEATDEADAPIELLPTDDGSGTGTGNITAIAKSWQPVASTGFEAVNARSADQATARITWGTAGTFFDSVVLSDTASDPATTPVADTVFEAFDLVRIPAITSGMDALLTFDRVVAVELYLPGSGWVEATGDPCPAACDGTFPGYTLTDAESAAATGVRLIVEESPTRSARVGTNPAAPPVGSGVAPSMGLDRRFDLVFEVRDVRRSDTDVAVLGSTRDALYNTGDFGVVNNTVRFDGRDLDANVLLTRTAGDTILIFDQPLTIEVTKSWVDGPLGTPPDGTPQDLYPRARMTIDAENTSVSRVDELSILDPVAGTDPFEAVNLYDIVSLTVPSGATNTEVILEHGPDNFISYTRTAALALTSAQLADVISIEVVHTGRIAVEGTTRLVVDTQLREDLRSTPGTRVDGVNSDVVANTARATITDPGGLAEPPLGETVNTLTAQASAQVRVENLSYGVAATKGIQADTTATALVPATQFDGNSRVATITLTGQPSGNVRSTDMVIEDFSPSFWNAYNFNGFGSHSFASPLNRVKVGVLLDVDYVLDGAELVAECNGSRTLDDCWVDDSDFRSTLVLPTLPPGATTSDIRGIRFHYTRSDGAAWERPFNPLQTVRFTVTRRDLLVEPSTEPVPSTLYIYTAPAPGESQIGVFTNDVTVTAWADNSPSAPLWQAEDDDTRQILFQHRPAEVRVVKTPFGPLTLGAPIPYEITVRNLGTGQDKDLAELQIVDLIPVDQPNDAPMLVLGTDPETNTTYDPEDLITISVVNASSQPVTAPSFTAELGASGPGGQPLTIIPDPAFVLQKGWTLTIQAPLLFRQFLEAGSVDSGFVLNSAIVTSDQEFDRCEFSTNGVLELDPQLRVESCTATTKVWALPSAPMNIVKGVKGVEAGPLDEAGLPVINPATSEPFDDLGIIRTVNNGVDCSDPTLAVNGEEYYRYPCVPITRPGGTEEWVGNFFNAGNVRVFEIVSIDVLPRENDRGVIINDARSSRWAPTLTERPRLVGWPDEALTVYYTDRLNLATPACNGADIQFELGMTPSSDPPMVEQYWPCITSGSPGGLPDRSNATTGWQVMPAVPDAALLESVIALKFVIDLTVGVDVADQGLVPGDDVSIVYRSETAREPVLREADANLARDSIAYNSIAGAARGRDGDNDLPYRFVTEPRKVGVALATGAIDLAKIVDGGAAAFAPGDFDIDVACSVDGVPISLLDSSGNDRSPFTITGNAASTRILGIPLYAECDISEVGTTGATTTTALPDTVTVRALDYSPSTVFNPRPAFLDREGDIELSEVTNTYDLAGLTISKTVDMNGAENANGDPVMQTGFNFSIACTFDTGAGAQSIAVSPSTFTLNDGQSRSYTGLPAGAVCTVNETQTRGATVTKVITTGGVAAASTSGASAVVTLAPNDGLGAATNAVDYTNSIPVGSLTVTKAITGAGATDPYDFGDGTFTVLVNCTRAAATIAPATQPSGAGSTAVWYGTLTFSAATQLSQTLTNIPAGSSCAITEQQSAGATQVTNPSNVTIVANSTVSRTVTNRFDLASLTIGKTVLTDAVDENDDPVYPVDPFAFEVSCTFQSDTVIADGFATSPMTFTLRHDQTRTLTGLPAGASCDVTETETQEADSTSISRTVGATSTSIDGTTTTISSLAANGGTVLAPVTRNSTQFTNRYGVTSFTISKDVIGGGVTQFAPATFTANVVCTEPTLGTSFDDDITVPANGFVTIENLADGSTCTVFEVDVPSTGADAHRIVDSEGEVITGEDIVVTTAAPGSATLENYYLTGELEVTKTVLGAGATYGDGPFEVTLVCERDGIAVDIVGGATRELLADGTASYTMLPSGAECTLTETDPAGATSSRILDENGAELTADVAAGVTFTVTVDETQLVDDQPQPALEVENTFELAGLSVTKTVSSDAVDANGAAIDYGPFPVSVTCTFEGDAVYGTGYDVDTPMQRDVADGETWSLTGLPDGADCTITETDTMDAVDTRVVTVVDGGSSTTFLGDSAIVTLGSATTAEIENDYTVGSIELAKSVVGAGAAEWADAPFEIDVTCVLDDRTGERTVFSDRFAFMQGDDPVTIENLATGALCTITETAFGGASSTSVTIDGSSVDGLSADVVVADELIEATVTNTFALGEVQVEKLRDGDGAATWGAGPFEVELTCVRDLDGVEQSVDVPGGALRELTSEGFYRATYGDLPLDAVCSLVETRTAGATSTSVDVDEVTVSAEPVAFTVTNTFDVGSVEVEKTFAGDGTGIFVEGPFEATLACTLEIDGVVTELEIPGGATRELTDLNGYRNGWDQIPAGAECAVTESRTGGATRSDTTDGEFVVVANETHTVGIENTFLLAAFSITKDVTGPFANEARDAVFLIETSCMWDRDGVLVPMLPGGWPVIDDDWGGTDEGDSGDPSEPEPVTSVRSEIRDGTTVMFENLPANSVCSITEVDSGGATGQLVWLGGVLQFGDLTLAGGLNDSTLSNVFMITLAETGAVVEIMLWLWVIAALLFGGLVMLTIARRRAAAH